MQIERNLFNRDFLGRMQPTIAKNKKPFTVHKLMSGKYEIVSCDFWICSRAIIGDWPFYEVTPLFDSMIQATKYMIDNISELN